ncbi:hypothetical protein [Prosthecobacter vanneervenii]|uniref:Uncharacterized protein n=1 Tax=Prosthecobacter vanneervenii TaxID=48466 RepID=A0A7W7Y7X4_9BACT|nr:hypothetical protein [Prosthecobacter vanneervenii]MBB5030870.1 hypothetical protein [Prosthecobacter vanneervenii]
MKREKLRRFLFVGAVCLLSFPWLTPCGTGVIAAAGISGTRNAFTRGSEPEARLPTRQLRGWASRPASPFSVISSQPVPLSRLIGDEELVKASGGQDAPYPGSLVGKGASALVDGVAGVFLAIDPLGWSDEDIKLDMNQFRRRQLVLCESPYVVLQGTDLRFTRDGKKGPVRLAKAKYAVVSVITEEGSYSAAAKVIHYRGPSEELILETPYRLFSGYKNRLKLPVPAGTKITLNYVKRTLSSNLPPENAGAQ